MGDRKNLHTFADALPKEEMFMQYICLPPGISARRLPFYLAMEEYVAREKRTGHDAFFIWQVEPTVIFGRNQLIENEVNLDYCRRNGIQTYRRKSGGGCVYADSGNIMFSYITDEQGVNFTYGRYVSLVVGMLQRLGVPATASGRNDILVDGRKVSGNAFYRLPGRSIVHGTMLYDTNMQHMEGALTPDGEKLHSKGVESVRQRIALLRDYLDIDLQAFKDFACNFLCGDERLMLAEADVARIEELEQEYLATDFIMGHNPRYSVVRRRRMEGVGTLEARLELKNGMLKGINLVGDYFLVGDLDGGLLALLRDVPLCREALESVVPDRLDNIIRGLRREDFIRLLTEDRHEG